MKKNSILVATSSFQNLRTDKQFYEKVQKITEKVFAFYNNFSSKKPTVELHNDIGV